LPRGTVRFPCCRRQCILELSVVCAQSIVCGTTGEPGQRATPPAVTEFVLGRATRFSHRTAAPTVKETPSRLKSAPTVLVRVSPLALLHKADVLFAAFLLTELGRLRENPIIDSITITSGQKISTKGHVAGASFARRQCNVTPNTEAGSAVPLSPLLIFFAA